MSEEKGNNVSHGRHSALSAWPAPIHTIEGGFVTLLARLTPARVQLHSIDRELRHIESALQKRFLFSRVFPIGSVASGTHVDGHSDIDVLASLDLDEPLPDSRQVLVEIRSVVSDLYPTATVECPVVRVPDVRVPGAPDAATAVRIHAGVYVEPAGGRSRRRVYAMSDSRGGWSRAAPEAHSTWVAKKNARMGGTLTPLIRLLKGWKFLNDIPIRSFYLEMFAASLFTANTAIQSSRDVAHALARLATEELRPQRDPIKMADPIQPCESADQVAVALDALKQASRHATAAWEAETDDDLDAAFEEWERVFGDVFPLPM